MPPASKGSIASALANRFRDAPAAADIGDAAPLLQTMAARGSCRAFHAREIPQDWLATLSAVALSAPTKSDLQQRDIIMLEDAATRRDLAKLIPGQDWVADAPMIAVFCGNNRRQRLLHDWQNVPFANDHFDAVFNAIGDAAIAMGAFVTAAEAMGLGCCPISAVRNEAAAVSDLLELPAHVFPFAGLAFGFPQEAPPISPRLPLGVTYHIDRYNEDGLREAVKGYDHSRAARQPYVTQRQTDVFGQATSYTWSIDKVRKYSVPERADFGAYIRARGFKLD